MVRIKLIAFLTISLMFVASCAIAELDQAPVSASTRSRGVRTKSAPVLMSRRDSLRLLYEYQTRGDAFLLNHLTGTKGSLSLEISRKDAVSLGISPEMYDFYSSFVEQQNEKV